MRLPKVARLPFREEQSLEVPSPVSEEERQLRREAYPQLGPNQFARQFRDPYKPVSLTRQGKEIEIQINHCDNPFCKWYGMNQHRFEEVKHKPSRYKLVSTKNGRDTKLQCNHDPVRPGVGSVWECQTPVYSNWSAADEIARLVKINEVVREIPEYTFHQTGCIHAETNPVEAPERFIARGRGKSGSERWQCRTCGKLTNTRALRRVSFNYHQKRNDILLDLARHVVNRVPVKRTCEILGIGSGTYYRKLELLYQRCLEFLERHETKAFASRTFPVMWIDTDKFIYFLNNVRRKGSGGARYDETEEPQFPTHIIVSTDIISSYVFRADLAYDWYVTMEDLEAQTDSYCDDHMDYYHRKYARLRIDHAPKPPTILDMELPEQYAHALRQFEMRKKYIDGLHVNSTYTTYAHYCLLKELVQAEEWRFVTDEDTSLIAALHRAFAKEIRRGLGHHFLCKIDRTKTRQEAYREYQGSHEELREWAAQRGIVGDKSITRLAYLKLVETLKRHSFHTEAWDGNKLAKVWGKGPIAHPLPREDQGFYEVDCTTDLSAYEPEQIAEMVLRVSDQSTNDFMQQIRRRISILERPMTTARGDGKSYIYSNFNPKYAQYCATILRVYYNFCTRRKGYGGTRLTPAQRIGIADRVYEWKDIIYFT
ncbi:insertion element protein [Paenibacillus sp. TRM 82003]|nr:insertion element protein [Paenibacillus sp. TRM 82003]